MKNVISTAFVGALGGACVLIANHFLVNTSPTFAQQSLQNSAPVHYASYTGAGSVAPDFVNAADKSLNAVVHIKTVVESQANLAYDPFQEWFFGGRQRQPNTMQGSGSGVIISNDGYIITNNHVVKDASKIEIVLNDKRSYQAEVIGLDPNTDLALLKIQDKNLPYVSYGNSDAVKIGEWVLAVGNPFNLNSTVTAGIISAKGRNINILEHNNTAGGLAPIESFLQTDAAVNPGNSGGALVNTNGDLVGINTAIASNNGSYQGYSFAIPVNIVKKVVSDLIEFGVVQRAFIGMSIQDIDAKFAEDKNIKQLKGVYINGLTEGGAGDVAGVKIGDIVTKVEGVEVKTTSELLEQIGKYHPSDKITLTLIREEEELTLPIVLKNKENTLSLNKKPIISRTSINSLGIEFEEVTAEELSRLKINSGVKIAKLHQGKLANVGLKEGFIITSVDKKKITTTSDIKNILEHKSGGVLIEGVYPNGTRAYYGFGL